MPPASLLQDPEYIVGRATEQNLLRSALDRAGEGRGTLVLLSGESGIGKTALVRDLAEEAGERGFLSLIGGCYDITSTPPYGPWFEAVHSVKSTDSLPQLPAWLADSDEVETIDGQSALFDEVWRFLVSLADQQPLLLVLEDLHWSDPSSLEMLRFIARSTESLPVLFLATFREDELDTNHPLTRLLPQLVREARPERILLRGLEDDDVRTLIRDRYRLQPDDESHLLRYLQSRAEGNPFFLIELFRVLEMERFLWEDESGWRIGDLEHAPVPPLVRQIVETRLAALDTATRHALEIAAVVGQDVPLDVWQTVAEASPEELSLVIERASAERLITETATPPGIKFTHSQIRDTLYQGIVLPRRQEIHRRVAGLLASHPSSSLNVVASHFADAEDPRAIEWLVRAGEHALALYAAQDAIALFNRAESLAGRLDREFPPAAYRARAAAYAMHGDFARARRDYEIGLEWSRSANDRPAEWQALIDLGLLWAARDYERTGQYYRTALDLAREIDEKPMIAYSLNRIANWHINQDQPDVAIPLHQEALKLFEESNDQDGITDTLDLLGIASYLSCDLATSATYCERAIRLFRERNDLPRLSTCLAILTLTGGDLTCNTTSPVYRESTFWTSTGEEALAIAREIEWPDGEAFALIGLSLSRSVRGDLECALREAETAAQIAEKIGHRQWEAAARTTIGIIWRELLDLERSRQELEHALTLARRSGSNFWTSLLTAELAMSLTSIGALSEAGAVLETVSSATGSNVSMGQRQCSLAHADLLLAHGEAGRALEIIDSLNRSRPAASPDHGVPQLLKMRADALYSLERFDDAEHDYLQARESAVLFGYLPIRLRIDRALADLYRAMGRPDDARRSTQSGKAAVDELAALISNDSLRDAFRERTLASPQQPEPASNPPTKTNLSPREFEVLQLLVEGKTDREIAEELFISPRTVMRHVGTILNKLDVPSRTAAASRAIRENLI